MTGARKLPVLSASQIATFEACPRKWAYTKLDGVEAPAHPSAQFGTQVHAHLEEWFAHRTLPPDTDTGKVARAMLPHLPAPQAIRPENVEIQTECTKLEQQYSQISGAMAVEFHTG